MKRIIRISSGEPLIRISPTETRRDASPARIALAKAILEILEDDGCLETAPNLAENAREIVGFDSSVESREEAFARAVAGAADEVRISLRPKLDALNEAFSARQDFNKTGDKTKGEKDGEVQVHLQLRS